jgi:dephospho-CoA kinase
MTKRLIGLTGGIATGKTTVSRYLADKYKLPILDADIYAREAVQFGSPILEEIWHRYGKEVQFSDGTLNRKALGEIIFNNPGERQWLESKIHPYVHDKFASQIKEIDRATIVLVIPLLFEAKMTDLVTETWLVYCPQEQQIQRLINRNNLTKEQAMARINSQFPLERKIQLADIVLDNSLSLESLSKQIDSAVTYSRS